MTNASDNFSMLVVREQRTRLLTAQFASALRPRFVEKPVLMATAAVEPKAATSTVAICAWTDAHTSYQAVLRFLKGDAISRPNENSSSI